ncbi:hypothetical protein Dsin_010072 [Dipteronia sinensis]|uniref:Uncharacterized protein n=1 Tax=Dipteronia sinensis TaxID=43782 RepID=A0AAE0AT09_9ROSI|nr:hypothetical protein Dsin_010072 [Dipteronia sinensis]
MALPPGLYSGTGTLALVASASGISFGLVDSNIKLKIHRMKVKSHKKAEAKAYHQSFCWLVQKMVGNASSFNFGLVLWFMSPLPSGRQQPAIVAPHCQLCCRAARLNRGGDPKPIPKTAYTAARRCPHFIVVGLSSSYGCRTAVLTHRRVGCRAPRLHRRGDFGSHLPKKISSTILPKFRFWV